MGKHYSIEFKLWAISLASEHGINVRQAAEYCGLSNHSQIVIWLQLLQELEYLRAENAYLKKSLALKGLKLKRKNVPLPES